MSRKLQSLSRGCDNGRSAAVKYGFGQSSPAVVLLMGRWEASHVVIARAGDQVSSLDTLLVVVGVGFARAILLKNYCETPQTPAFRGYSLW
ncbi:MAG: hypothetical protein L7U72_11095 [Rubripirellula sp.]|nr:hypothetical protein [Rubripirellula sp.]